jgi:hypothetical protein
MVISFQNCSPKLLLIFASLKMEYSPIKKINEKAENRNNVLNKNNCFSILVLVPVFSNIPLSIVKPDRVIAVPMKKYIDSKLVLTISRKEKIIKPAKAKKSINKTNT